MKINTHLKTPRTFTLENTGATHSFRCLSWVFGAKCKSRSKQLFASHALLHKCFFTIHRVFLFSHLMFCWVWINFVVPVGVHVHFARRKLQAGSAKALGNLGNKNKLEFLNTYETCLQNLKHFPQKQSNFRTHL
jgi:hypothetical protein